MEEKSKKTLYQLKSDIAHQNYIERYKYLTFAEIRKEEYLLSQSRSMEHGALITAKSIDGVDSESYIRAKEMLEEIDKEQQCLQVCRQERMDRFDLYDHAFEIMAQYLDIYLEKRYDKFVLKIGLDEHIFIEEVIDENTYETMRKALRQCDSN